MKELLEIFLNNNLLTVQLLTEITDVAEVLWITVLNISEIMESVLKALIHIPLKMELVKSPVVQKILSPSQDILMYPLEVHLPLKLLVINNQFLLPLMQKIGLTTLVGFTLIVEQASITESYLLVILILIG